MRLRLVMVVWLVGVTSGMVVLAPRAPAQTDIDAARLEVDTATDELESLLERLDSTQRRGNELAAKYWQVESGLELIDRQVAQAQAQHETLGQQRSELLDQVRAIALNQYVTTGQDLLWTDLDSVADREAAEALAELVVGSDQGTLDQLAVVQGDFKRIQAELQTRREGQQAALDEVTATQNGIADELDEIVLIRGALQGELIRLEEALDALEVAEVERLATAERERLAEQRLRAEQAAARAAALARIVPTPTATSIPTPAPVPPTPVPSATAVPNPQPSEPFPTATSTASDQGATEQGSDDGPVDSQTATTTAVPNPQPSEPFPTPTPDAASPSITPTPTPIPNPQPGGSGSGGIVCPLAGAFTHTDDFNSPRAVGGVHRANDLIASSGTPVIAVASGTIDHRNSSVGGLSAHLKGDNGDYYFYTHLNGYENVGIGRVSAGMVIGYVGMTGNAPIPHLHFEIHRNGYGNYTNPYGPVRTACGL